MVFMLRKTLKVEQVHIEKLEVRNLMLSRIKFAVRAVAILLIVAVVALFLTNVINPIVAGVSIAVDVGVGLLVLQLLNRHAEFLSDSRN